MLQSTQTPDQPQSSALAAYLGEHALEIEAARHRIAPYIRRTPTLSTELDSNLLLKCECFQHTGSFKPRGAFNAVLRLRETEPAVQGVIAVSSGNHAQAVALAARTAGLKAVILIPADANPQKVAATRALGAEVITEGVTFENREARLREVQRERGLALVHPFDDWAVIHGQATAALEVLDEHPEVAVIATPIGGGGLASGTALAAKARNSELRVVAVEPETADDASQTWRSRALRVLPRAPRTIADGVRTVAIGQRNFEVLVERRLIDEIVTVSERQLEEALLRAWTTLKLALEPTAALPLAAYLAGKLPSPGKAGRGKLALVLTGGNFDLALVARLLSR